jgi:hypothetical protein
MTYGINQAAVNEHIAMKERQRGLAESLTQSGIGRAYGQSTGICGGLDDVPKRHAEIPETINELQQAVEDLGAVIERLAERMQPVMNIASMTQSAEVAEKQDQEPASARPAATEVSRRIAASSSRLYCLNRTIRALTEALEV